MKEARGRRSCLQVTLLGLVALGLAGCEKPEAPAMPPPSVTVAQPVRENVTLHYEFTGTTEAVHQVEIRARVEGYLRSIEFEDGAFVEAGDLLFVIEPDPYDVKVSQAQAQLTSGQADLARAEADFRRIQQAAETNAVSKQQVDMYRAQRDVAQAGVEQANAALAEARLQQGYTKVYSPITGRVSRRYVDVGNLVGAAERTLLARVATIDPLHVYFNVSERVLATRLKEMSKLRSADRATQLEVPCFVGLPNDEGYPYEGAIDYADIAVEAGTGTIQIRASLPNEDFRLYPGMFVRVRIPRPTSEDAVLVSERAIGTDLAGKYLLVVGANNVVERRSVQIGALLEGRRVIEAGIAPAERYIVNGMQRARPGLPVTPQPAQPMPSKTPVEGAPAQAGEGGTMFSRIFIHRPILACVISIVILLVGGISIPLLSVEKTPDITPPTVVVSAKYPGASAEVIADTVATPLEQQINGVDDMIYMSSKSSGDGTMEITVTFEVGTDVDMANVLVQNRVAIAEPMLPEEVKRQGITTKKRSTSLALMVALTSPNGRYDTLFLSNYVNIQIADVLKRIPGVADVTVFGAQDYGMRVWLDPEQLKSRGLGIEEVLGAIREQNVQVAAGQIGAPPSPKGQVFQYTVNTLGRLSDVEAFQDIVVKVSPDGRLLRLRDVARVELGSQTYSWYVQLNGAPSIALGVYQLPGANALEIATAVRAEMARLKDSFPEGLDYVVPYDPTLFISESIKEVVITLIIAVGLVVFTVYIFLQDFRTTLIPAVTIPVSLIGTFAVMLALGLSINTLTLFGLVLVIGIVVDDAIVVVENTMRLIDEEKLGARDAATKAMEQITGPVIATTLVLLAVFVPTAMMGGITGRLYSQFALTISVATVFSSINALTLSPALCSLLLRPTPSRRGWVFTQYNKLFDVTTRGYLRIVKRIVRRVAVPVVLFLILVALTGAGLMAIPGGFLPDEDEGVLFVNALLPDGASLERTREVLDRINGILAETPGVANVTAIGGYSLLEGLVVPNGGAFFISLNPWDERQAPELHVSAIVGRLQRQLAGIQEAICFAFIPPPISGLGMAGGFEMQLQDRGTAGLVMLETVGRDLMMGGQQHPALTRLNSSFRASVPQLYLDIDRTKAKTLGVPLGNLFSALQGYLGSAYVNDFNIFGRTYRVMTQADHRFRDQPEDILQLEVRNRDGRMVPLSTLVSVSETAGPQTIFRYNLFPSSTITGQPVPGVSSGQSIKVMETLAARTLPPSMGFEWSGVTFQQIQAGNMAPIIFSLAIVFVYLFLAAQYESWSIPVAIILTIPYALFGAVLATWLRSLDNNVYTQIGLVLLIGLSAKTSILIVEFAKQLRAEGRSIPEAAVEAAKLRFRAILMTAFSFILGVFPLLVASGAGAASRRSLGTAVFGGMLASVVFGVFLTPVLYVVVQSISEKIHGLSHERDRKQTSEVQPEPAPVEG